MGKSNTGVFIDQPLDQSFVRMDNSLHQSFFLLRIIHDNLVSKKTTVYSTFYYLYSRAHFKVFKEIIQAYIRSKTDKKKVFISFFFQICEQLTEEVK